MLDAVVHPIGFRTNARLYAPENVTRVLDEVARGVTLTVVIDVDALERSALAKVDRVMLLALDALSYAQVQVVLLSTDEAERTAVLHRGVSRSWWLDCHAGWRERAMNVVRGDHPISMSQAIARVRERTPGTRLIGISDDPALLDCLTEADRGILLGSEGTAVGPTVTSVRDLAVRAVMWWLVDVRSKPATTARR
jgi:hypothetical protein